MTISSEERKAGPYPGNSVATTFPFGFKIFKPEDLLVVLTIDGAEQDLEFGDDYGVSLNSDQENSPGGEVVLNTPLPSGQLLTMTSAAKNLQPTKITNQGAFYPEVVNQALDRVTILIQQVDEKVGRSVKVPISSTVTPDDLISQLTNDAASARAAAQQAGASQSAAELAAGSASASAGSAAESENNASQSALAAAASEGNASLSEQAAAASAGEADLSAQAADASKEAAAVSEQNASDSADLAQSFVEMLSGMTGLFKLDKSSPCLVKTAAGALSIKAGTIVYLAGGPVSFPLQTAVSMPAVLTPGEDYAVFVRPDGTASAAADPFFAPAAAPVPGALKIGGFHYGLTAPGTTPASGGFATTGFTNSGGNYVWTQARVDRVAGINEFSIWDLTHRSKGEQHGFTFDPQRKVWDAIYFCSPDHITNGISRYNTPVASGTVPPKIPLGEYGGDGVMTYGRLSAYEALEILASHGCRLMTQEEFASGALGVTEGQSLGGAASTIPATKREPGYTSRIGLEQATGHIWTIGGPLTSVGGSAWTAGPNRGNFYGGAGLPLFGGDRASAANSGSRASYWYNVFWYSSWSIGLRAACDHLSA